MAANGGLSCKIEAAAFILFHGFPDGALLLRKYFNSGGRKGLDGIRADMTGDDRTHIFIRQKLRCLDAGPSASGGALVIKNLVTHVCRINDQKPGAATKARVERRIQRFT
jgi:hypothetical protein